MRLIGHNKSATVNYPAENPGGNLVTHALKWCKISSKAGADVTPPHVIPVISGGPVSDYENYEDKRDLDRYGKPTEPSGFGFGRLLILALIVAGIFWFYKYSQQSAERKIEKDKRERIEESQTEKKGANRSRRAVNAPANG